MASTSVKSTMKSGRKASKRRYCCVKDCHNREGLPGIRLYRFHGRPWEEQRRKKWILAVRRVNQSDGSEWTPNSSSRICSSHFVNGQKSNISTHPSYNPTVFPDVYKVRPFIGSDNLERFKRQVALRALGWLDNISYQVCGLVCKITSGGSGCAATLFTGYTVEFCCSCFSEVRTYVRAKIFWVLKYVILVSL
ncbi:peroxynitrite isomerase THAP4-like [Haemaphysalis longicornis]